MIIDENNYKDFLRIDGNGLHCSNMGITEIRYLPEGIKELYCLNNKLTSLPKLPDSLEILNCHYNKITSLPELPKSLRVLNCENNNLTSLPELPDSLERLYCEYNDLPIQGNYYSKQDVKDYKHKLNQYNLINQILEKI